MTKPRTDRLNLPSSPADDPGPDHCANCARTGEAWDVELGLGSARPRLRERFGTVLDGTCEARWPRR